MDNSLPNTMNIFPSLNKLRAFTLLELLIGMIVSGIVLTAVWTSWHIVISCSNRFSGSVQRTENASLFLSRIYEDYYRADSVNRTGNDLHFFSSNRTVSYQSGNDCIVRVMNDHTDTFHVTVMQTEINSGDLKMQLILDGQHETLLFSRPFSSAAFIEHP